MFIQDGARGYCFVDFCAEHKLRMVKVPILTNKKGELMLPFWFLLIMIYLGGLSVLANRSHSALFKV